MKLLIDIGNTNTSMALVKDGRIRKRFFIHTSRKEIEPRSLARLLGEAKEEITEVAVVSVVPVFLRVMRKSLESIISSAQVRIVGKDIKVPIKNRYKKPQEVGGDRLVGAFAAAKLFKPPILIIDFGTAVTFDFVGESGSYEGGLIFPGMRLGLESLVKKAALLHRIDVRSIKGLIGRDTRGSMNKGLILGYASMCDGIIQLFKEEYGRRLKVIATGGDAKLVAKHSRHMRSIHPDLIFEGLTHLLEKT